MGQQTDVRLLFASYIKGNVLQIQNHAVIELPSKLWIKWNTWNHTERRVSSNSKVSKIFGFEHERCSPDYLVFNRSFTRISLKQCLSSFVLKKFLRRAEPHIKAGRKMCYKWLSLMVYHFDISRVYFAKVFWFTPF